MNIDNCWLLMTRSIWVFLACVVIVFIAGCIGGRKPGCLAYSVLVVCAIVMKCAVWVAIACAGILVFSWAGVL